MVECEGFKPLRLPVKSPARPKESWKKLNFCRAFVSLLGGCRVETQPCVFEVSHR